MSILDACVSTYCRLYKQSGRSPVDFALAMLASDRELCSAVLVVIGSWPSSEPELRALQRLF